MLAAQAWWQSIGLVLVGAVITAAVGYFVSTAQFNRQQKVDHERWLREQRLAAYRLLTETLKSQQEIIRDAIDADSGASIGVARKDAPTSVNAATSAAHLVGGLEVTDALNKLRNQLWDVDEDGPSYELYSDIAGTVADLDHAMRDEVQGDLTT